MEEKIKILIVPSLSESYWVDRLREGLTGMGYEVKISDGAFDEIVGLRVISETDYLSWKPDLVVATGVGCIAVGTFVKALRVMIDPDFHYSDFLKEWARERRQRIASGMYDASRLFEVKRECEDAEYDAREAERLESKEKSLRGEKPMLCIFTTESGDKEEYRERYGDYVEIPSLDLNKNESIDSLADIIATFLKENT